MTAQGYFTVLNADRNSVERIGAVEDGARSSDDLDSLDGLDGEGCVNGEVDAAEVLKRHDGNLRLAIKQCVHSHE